MIPPAQSQAVRSKGLAAGMLDHGLSAASNVALTIMVARAVDVTLFGVLSLSMILFSIALGISRSLLGEPLLTRMRGTATVRGVTVARRGASLGVLLSAPTLVLGIAASPMTEAVLALAVCLPILVAHDSLRYWAFAASRPAIALELDAIWLAAIGLAALASTFEIWRITVPSAIGLWGAGCFAALVFVLARHLRALNAPSTRDHARLVAANFDIGRQYLVQFATTYAASAAAFLIAPLVIGLHGAGELRAAFFAYSGVNVLVAATLTVGVRAISSTKSAAETNRLALRVSSTLCALVMANMVLLEVIPVELGTAVLGDSFAGARRLAVPVGLAVAASMAGLGPLAALRAIERARALTRARVLAAGCTLVLTIVASASAVDGARGFALGWLAGSILGTSALWWTWRRERAREQQVEQ